MPYRAAPCPPVAAGLALLLSLLLGGCPGTETPALTIQFPAFGTTVDVSIVGMPRAAASAAAAEVEQDLLFLHRELHPWEPGPLWRVNELLASGEAFAAPPSLLPLLRKSQALAQASDHLFNPATGRLQALWGFHTDPPECRPPPARGAVARLVAARPTMADIALDGILLVSHNPAVALDFHAIAAAYAADLGITTLKARGVRSAMIRIGEDVRAIGGRAGRPWRVPVRAAGGGAVLGVLTVSGEAAVFTASEARRNFLHDGNLYHNVINPRTGYPARDFRAVTVLHEGDGATAAAAAEALMIAGEERWQEISRRMGVSRVLLQEETGAVIMTPELAALFEPVERDLPIVRTESFTPAAQP